MARIAVAMLAASVLSAQAVPTQDRVASDPASMELLARDCIVVTATGHVQVAYPDLARAFQSPDLLGDLQREYARQLPEGQAPEFVIEQRAPGEYHYVNRENHESNIREVHRAEHEGPVTELVLLVSGKRFFGRFQALVHVAVMPAADNGLRYESTVYAYPKAGVARFFARHLGLVERYFLEKTKEIEILSAKLGAALCAQAPDSELNLVLAKCPD